MADEEAQIPGILTVLGYLESSNPLMHLALQKFIVETMEREEELLERLAFYEGAAEEEGEALEPAPAELEIDEEEAAWAPLPDEDGEWMLEEEHPEPAEESSAMPASPMEVDEDAEPEQGVRELVLRNRTIIIPVPATPEAVGEEMAPEAFQVGIVEGLPEQFRQELREPENNAYEVVMDGNQSSIICGFCGRRFETLKGWRIHATRMHKQDGFCTACGHILTLPPTATAAQKQAAVELHISDWCPRARKSIVDERRVKRRRLELAGKDDLAQNIHIPIRWRRCHSCTIDAEQLLPSDSTCKNAAEDSFLELILTNVKFCFDCISSDEESIEQNARVEGIWNQFYVRGLETSERAFGS
ncbi:unnamed protein product [Thelazia callipaeda]|uniref:C2H2-type domain-containing protein n=1 Tax=Thelazia callipaeda TaxID=103827 RepID=A0A0N5DC73_THECL|nr:unnamed protein product [Thelazia callipaeda]